MRATPELLKHGLLLLLLAAAPVSHAQSLPAAGNPPFEKAAAWMARVQLLPHASQLAALREHLQADAHRTFRNDLSQMAVCYTFVAAATRARLDSARRSASDTVVHDARVLFVLNGHLLDGPEAATALAAVPTRAIRPLRFLTGTTAQALSGTRAKVGVVIAATR